MTKVSVIVPCYNTEQYLYQCMESIINQTLKEIEIICVDDGSTDETGKMLDDYASKDSRIKVIHKENGGYGKAMNVGLDSATGEYIGIVEPDDYVSLDMYETLYNKVKEIDVDFVKADYYDFTGNDDGINLHYKKIVFHDEYYNKVINPEENLGVFDFPISNWTGIYKREFIEKYNIRHNETPGASYQDTGFFFKLLVNAKRIYFINKPFYMYRKDNANSSVNNKGKVFCLKEEFDLLREYLENNETLKEKFLKVYNFRKFGGYLYNYNRIALEFKKEFLEVFHKEFKEAYKNGEIDEGLFEPSQLKRLHLIIKNPRKFYLRSLSKLTFLERIFSLRNLNYGLRTYKMISILGIKIKIRNRKKEEENFKRTIVSKLDNLDRNIRQLKKEINDLKKG